VVQKVVTSDGQMLAADLVIIAAGVQPNTNWLKETINLDERGWIETDPYLRTNQPDILAIGDAIKPLWAPVGRQATIALASTARREARYVTQNIGSVRPDRPFAGVNGSSALRVFDLKISTTGLNEFSAQQLGLTVESSLYRGTLLPSFVTIKNPEIMVKLIFDPLTNQILGGQVVSQATAVEMVNTIALAIKGQMTLEDLAKADFFFQPGFDKQWSILNLAAQHALGEEPSVV
jgi:NADH peroxidase